MGCNIDVDQATPLLQTLLDCRKIISTVDSLCDNGYFVQDFSFEICFAKANDDPYKDLATLLSSQTYEIGMGWNSSEPNLKFGDLAFCKGLKRKSRCRGAMYRALFMQHFTLMFGTQEVLRDGTVVQAMNETTKPSKK